MKGFCLSLTFSLLALALFFTTPANAQDKFCAGCSAACVGNDGGPCCSSYVAPANQTYCATYCLVTDYTCCGCVVYDIGKGIYDCFGCPSDTRCTPKAKNYPELPFNQTGWYCASGSSLKPSFATLALAALLSALLAFMLPPRV